MVNIFRSLALLAISLLVINTLWVFAASGDVVRAEELLRIIRATDHELRALQDPRSSPSKNNALEIKQRRAECIRELIPIQRLGDMRFLSLVAVALLVILVFSISITYFIGTSRWCKEVVQVYGLDQQFVARSRLFKRQSFPWALGGIVVMLLVASLGGKVNPSFRPDDAARWTVWYQFVAGLGTIVIGLCSYKQSWCLSANYKIIQEIVEKVHRVREAHGVVERDETPRT